MHPDFLIRPALPSDDFSEIARLIMLTDPYIYPAAFGMHGLPALEKMICSGKTAFGYSRITLVLSGTQIIGQSVVLDRSPVDPIDPDEYLMQFPHLPSSFRHVVCQYLNHLPDYVTAGDEIYIACVSVDPNTRGKGAGSALMQYLIQEHPDYLFRLHVLADNPAAISLYKAHGFSIEGNAEPGYAYNEPSPLCYEMIRKRNPLRQSS